MVLLVVHLCLLLRWLDWLKDRGQNNERSGNGGGRLETRKDVRCMYILLLFGLRHHYTR